MNPEKTRLAGVVLGAFLAWVTSAGAQSTPDSSAWGDIPAPSDSTSAVLTTSKSPTWAKIVDAPYDVVTYPIKLVGEGVGEVVEFSDRIGLTSALGNIFSRRLLPPYTSVGFKAGGDDGFGGSFAIAYPEMPGEGNTIRLKLDAATGGDRGGSLAAGFGTLDRGELQIGGGYRLRAATRFFGLGPDSREDDRSIYLEETGFGGATLTRRLGQGFQGALGAYYTGVSARGTHRDEDPALKETFADAIPPGYGDRSEGATASLELRHDNTSEATRPERGGLRRARVSAFRSTNDDDMHFWTWRGEIQQFVPLWFTKRALAVRGFVTKIEPQGDQPIDFQRLMTNDEPDLLRGYPDLRFRDEGFAIATAEYRWPVWSLESSPNMGADMYAFTDVGQVFSEVKDIGDDLTTSWGGGLRLGSFKDFVGRVEFAMSNEGTQFRFGFEQVFQYDKAALLRGRIPVPDR